MKDFKNFLLENIEDIEKSMSDPDNDEVIFHIDNDGEIVVEENTNVERELQGDDAEDGDSDDFVDPDDFDMFYSDEEAEEVDESEDDEGERGRTWGNETIIDLNFDDEGDGGN